MSHRLEVALQSKLFDAEGEKIRSRAQRYFNITLSEVRTVKILTLDIQLNPQQLDTIKNDIFTNPVTQVSSYKPLPFDFDWTIWVGYKPGVRDNPGSTAKEAIEDLCQIKLGRHEAVYTSKRYLISGLDLSHEQMQIIATEMLSNDIIQQYQIISKSQWHFEEGIGIVIPKVILNHTPQVTTLSIDSIDILQRLSDERNLALNPNDIPVIRDYFLKPNVINDRKQMKLSAPTDIELEYISQARSDHCNHNTFQGKFTYLDTSTQKQTQVDNLFKACIQKPTLALQNKKDWVVSVLWDNAGAGKIDDDYLYVITGETHNSPSNMEAYGGSLTGIVGVYRDPMGTGKGAKLVMGGYGFCVGNWNYNGDIKPKLAPRRLLEGIIEGVKDGGNKSGIPTTFGQVYFDDGYMGKCLVFVTAIGVMPTIVDNALSHEKRTNPGDLMIMCGGRVGKDGLHGVTASSEVFSENTPAGHVQIGDPYTQKKMHDFLLEARDEGLITFITDNGGGGLSSSVGESARFSNGCDVQLDRVPLKYDGLDQWEIWVSESQERMTVAVHPDHLETFMALSHKHEVESTVIGTYTDSGKLHITYDNETIAYVDMDLLTEGFPQWEFKAEWTPPQKRGMTEPIISTPNNFNDLLCDMLAHPNACSKEWITRQYDHEVQGKSVIKPLVGRAQDVPSDAAVIRPILESQKGLAFAQSLLPSYSSIDAYHMVACTMDEAVRRVISVGGDVHHIGGVDNFCWPSIQYDPVSNPDGKFKAAQLVRACWALKDICEAYEIPLLSGKDSMYVDGHLKGKYGETHKISALETMQFSTLSLVPDIEKCVSMEIKMPGDLVYLIGDTKNELGGSLYYDLFNKKGLNVPQVRAKTFFHCYCQLSDAIQKEIIASAHGIYRGGLGVHLAFMAMGGQLGIEIDLSTLAKSEMLTEPMGDDVLLFSETPGRFLVTISPKFQLEFEKIMESVPIHCIGHVTQNPVLQVNGLTQNRIIDAPVAKLTQAWKKLFSKMDTPKKDESIK